MSHIVDDRAVSEDGVERSRSVATPRTEKVGLSTRLHIAKKDPISYEQADRLCGCSVDAL